MAENKRITNSELEANYVDGQILYGEDINRLIDVLKEGVNANKNDLDMHLAGYRGAPIKDTYLELADVIGYTGQYGFVLNGAEFDQGINVYLYAHGTWTPSHKLSLQGLYDLVHELIELVPVGGVSFEFTETQPVGQIAGDFWYDTSD